MYKFLITILLTNFSLACSEQAHHPMAQTSILEIHLFLGIASAGQNSKLGYPVGERHAILVFFRQPANTEPDWEQAKSYVEGAGWSKVDLQKASKVDPKTLDDNPDVGKSYEEAMSNGKAMIVYSGPVKD
jgi:hypothetical protein